VMTGLVAAASSPERGAEIESSVIAGTPLRRGCPGVGRRRGGSLPGLR
jgi:hypothetical protein